MPQDLKMEVSTQINAPAFKVWDALTNPEQVKKYFFGTKLESSLVVGEPIIFSGEWEGKPYQDKGTVLENITNRILKYSYWSNLSGTPDLPENYATVTYRLEDIDGNTKLTIAQDGIKTEESKTDSENNWKFLLDSIKKLVEEV